MIPHRCQSETAPVMFLLVVVVFFATAAAPGQAQAPASGSLTSGMPAVSSVPSLASAVPSSFQGSVPTGQATSQVLQLSLREALDRGLRYNLGILLSEQSSQAARGARWQTLSALIPHLNASTTETREQINLEALGFPATKFPGFPIIVGPFNTFDARAAVSTPLLDLATTRQVHSAADNVRSAEYTYQDARNLVVLVVANAYLLANASQARVESVQAEVTTAQALYKQAVDRFHAGLSAEIDVLRAQVELKSRQQQLLAAQNAFAIDKLNLARAIGLPAGQAFALTSKNAYAPLRGITIEQALAEAYENRPDYKAALAGVAGAEEARRAILAERFPSISFNANFGDIGLTPGNSHETFLVAGTLNIPVFQGGRIHGELVQADARLKQQQDRLQNLKGQIDYDVRTAFLNLKTAADQVAVARSNIDLAHRTLQQARDRFAAGVTDNIEVVEAQQSVADADQSYISSLYEHNLAKVSLARAIGVAEQAVMHYLGGK